MTRFTINDINKVLENLVYKHLIICEYQCFIGDKNRVLINFQIIIKFRMDEKIENSITNNPANIISV